MTDLLKKICIAIIALLLSALGAARGQDNTASREDSAAILQTALNYIDGYYSGDAARMEKAIHPDLNKATPRDLPQTGRTTLAYTTYSGLMEFTRAKVGLLNDTARHVKVSILHIELDVANVKIASAKFIDYVQEVRIDGEWKIVNVIFTSGSEVPPRLKDFDSEAEKPVIEKTAMNYLAGITGGDAGRIEIAIDPEFSRISLLPVAQTGKTTIRRQRYESIVENAMAGIGKQDEIYRNNKVSVLDAADGLAIVRCETTGAVEFIQLYKGNGQWKLFNSVQRPNTTLTLEQAMTVTVGEPMPDFTLPVYGGGSFKLSDYKGKNVLLMFPRGWVVNGWCAYCPYQYLELEKMQMESNVMGKNNLQIAFVMPYSSEKIKDWMENFPDALAQVEKIKKPDATVAPGSIQMEYSNWVAEKFPIVFDVDKEDPHTAIPVLIDEERTLSRRLKIFTNFWDGAASEQNMASVFIIDKKGILRFKYIGQMTEDRPDVNFLINFIRDMD